MVKSKPNPNSTNTHTYCTHNSWWLVLGRVTIKKDHMCLGIAYMFYLQLQGFWHYDVKIKITSIEPENKSFVSLVSVCYHKTVETDKPMNSTSELLQLPITWYQNDTIDAKTHYLVSNWKLRHSWWSFGFAESSHCNSRPFYNIGIFGLENNYRGIEIVCKSGAFVGLIQRGPLLWGLIRVSMLHTCFIYLFI